MKSGIPATTRPVPSWSMGCPQQKNTFSPMPLKRAAPAKP